MAAAAYLPPDTHMKGEEPNFENQIEVINYIPFGRLKADSKQPAAPYIYTIDVPYPFVPDGERRIFSFREPKDVVVSAYHFMDSFLALKGRVSLPIFAHAYLKTIESQLNDLLMWWERRNDENMLLLFFDDLIKGRSCWLCTPNRQIYEG